MINSLFEDVFAQFENKEGGGQEDTDDDVSPHVRSMFLRCKNLSVYVIQCIEYCDYDELKYADGFSMVHLPCPRCRYCPI